MTYNEMLLETFIENIRELEAELSTLHPQKEYAGEIIEKFVTCKRPNCICQRGFPHGPNKYFRHRENGVWKELYLGKKIVDRYVENVGVYRRYIEITKELKVLRAEMKKVREQLGLGDENDKCLQLRLDGID